ncbi:MAG: response regulator [Peptostreptococcaceae bacterium]|nr:response regulator [Peptostreptococcaceae bacterium]
MKKIILLVCHSTALVKILREICRDLGYVFIISGNTRQAEDLYLEYDPDIVLLSCDLIKGSTMDLVKKIHSWDRSSSIILLSDDADRRLYEEYIRAGAMDIIIHPIHPIDLLSRIKVHTKIRTLKKQMDHQHQMLSTIKGISPATLTRIREFFRRKDQSWTIATAASEIGIAYQTMHRYVHHLLSAGELEVQQEYGNSGRPLNRYIFRR